MSVVHFGECARFCPPKPRAADPADDEGAEVEDTAAALPAEFRSIADAAALSAAVEAATRGGRARAPAFFLLWAAWCHNCHDFLAAAEEELAKRRGYEAGACAGGAENLFALEEKSACDVAGMSEAAVLARTRALAAGESQPADLAEFFALAGGGFDGRVAYPTAILLWPGAAPRKASGTTGVRDLFIAKLQS